MDGSLLHEENITNDKNSSISTNSSNPSLLDLPTELILNIIRMLPKSPYYKCLNVCKRLNAIENEYIVEYSTMCICRLREHSPNLPSKELKLLLCMYPEEHQLNTLIKIIKRRPITCKIKFIGYAYFVDTLKDYLKTSDDHMNVKVFLERCEPKSFFWSSWHLYYKCVNMCKSNGDELKKDFVTERFNMKLEDDEDFIKQISNILPSCCFRHASIECNNVNLFLLDHHLKNNHHIFDVFDFQKKVDSLNIENLAFKPIDVSMLSRFRNLHELTFMINEVDLDSIKSRLLELAQFFKQANLENLQRFTFFEKSSFGYANELIPAWTEFLNTIPSNVLNTLEIISEMKKDLDQNQLTTQSSTDLSLSHGLARFTRLEFLTIHHIAFDSTLLKILPSLRHLSSLDLRINMNMSNTNIIDGSCYNLERCSYLETLRIYVPAEATTLLSNIFVSLAKIKTFTGIDLYFDAFDKIPADECFENLRLITKLRYVSLYIKKNRK